MSARGFPAFPPVRRTGAFAGTWWGRAWVTAMEDSALDEAQLRAGRKYARGGYVGPITVSPGRITATVRDYEDDTAYPTVLTWEPLDQARWDRFLDHLAAQSGHLAALVEGEMPADLVDAAADAGVRLLPDIGDLDPECGCPGWELPCRHAAALAYQVSWLLDADPFVLLLLRGRDRDELVAHRPAGQTAVAAFRAAPAPLPPPPPVPTGEPVVADVPPADGVDPAEVARLAVEAVHRARRLLAEC